jgi:hypothetical protein
MASYIFLGFFTKAKVGATPASAPTVDVCNVATNALVVTAGSATALTSVPGLYSYTYSGAAGLRLVATFKTTDATVDQQHLPSYTPTEITDYLDATISSRNAVAPPTELSIAAAVRGELTTELALIDAATSTRLATAAYTAPTIPPETAAIATAVREELTAELALIDAATSTRLAAADYTAPSVPPTATAIADQVWEEVAADHATVLTTGALLAAGAVTGSDPLASQVPASYAEGTAGAALGRIAGAQVTVVSPVTAVGTTINLLYGDDYYQADGRALSFVNLNGPVLTGGTVVLRVISSAGLVSLAGVITDSHTCYVEISAAQIVSIGAGVWSYNLEATLVTSAHVVTLVAGDMIVSRDVR